MKNNKTKLTSSSSMFLVIAVIIIGGIASSCASAPALVPFPKAAGKTLTLTEIYKFDKDIRGVQGIAFNPSSKPEFQNLIASAGWNNTIFVWNFITKKLQYSIKEAHVSDVISLQFSQDGTLLFSAGLDNKIKVWNTSSGKLVKEINKFEKDIIALDVYKSNKGEILIAGAELNGDVVEIAYSTGKIINSFKHNRYATGVRFSPQASMIASTGEDGTVQLWDTKSKKIVKTLVHGKEKTNTVAFDSTGKYIASGGWDNTAKLWDVATGKQLFVFDGHKGAIESVDFSLDATKLLVGSRDGFISVWDVETGESIIKLQTGTTRVYNAKISPQQNHIAVAGYDHTVRIYSIGLE